MATLNNLLDEFINELKSDSSFNNIKFIKSYPYVIKPTRLSKPVVCLSLGEIDGECCGVGDDYLLGSYKLSMDIFVPYKIGSNEIGNIVNNIINKCKTNMPISVSTSHIDEDAASLCYVAKCSLTFRDIIDTGGYKYWKKLMKM